MTKAIWSKEVQKHRERTTDLFLKLMKSVKVNQMMLGPWGSGAYSLEGRPWGQNAEKVVGRVEKKLIDLTSIKC